MWGSDAEKYYNKVKQAVLETDDLVITYNHQVIDALFNSTSNGYTASSLEVFGYDTPYLQTVTSLVDIETTPYLRTNEKDIGTILDVLGISLDDLGDIEILSKLIVEE